MEKFNSEFIFNNFIFTLIISFACFLQISLNFLSFFVISQPYILAIILFITIRRLNYEASSILIILSDINLEKRKKTLGFAPLQEIQNKLNLKGFNKFNN